MRRLADDDNRKNIGLQSVRRTAHHLVELTSVLAEATRLRELGLAFLVAVPRLNFWQTAIVWLPLRFRRL